MSIRKIKDAKDLTTNELIYFKGHAQATYMSDGTTVEDAINNIEIGAQPSDLATVAKTGSYNDLTNKPTIPSAVTESTVSGWGFTKNTGTYSKPSSGIPKSDLASTVQTSLDKADTALQSHQDISGKQDKLVNGVNIKTINGLSLLGSGILTISGNSAYPQINHGTSNTTCMLQPNLFYVWDTVTELNLAFDEGVVNEANEYLFLFTSGETATTLFVPDDIKWTDGFIIIDANKIYQISILNGLGTVMSWDI